MRPASVATGDGASNNNLQQTALWAVSRSGTPSVIPGLGDALLSAEDTDRQIDIAFAIASIANRNPESTPAKTAAESQAVPALLTIAVTGETPASQQKAIRTIGRIGSADNVESLRKIADSNQQLQSAVSDAIREIEQRGEGRPGDSSRWFRAW